ncbi:unnamed protein product, partial [Vitis vinifera]
MNALVACSIDNKHYKNEAPSCVVLALVWLAAAALLSKLFSFRPAHKQNLPPGPKPWRIIGNLNLIGHLPHLSLHKLSQKYGQIMQLQFGSIVTVEEFQEMLDELFLLNGVLNIGDWIPWIAFLDLQGYVKRMKALRDKFDRLFDHVIEKHRARREAADFVAKDMVDMLLRLADDPDLEVKLGTDGVKGLTLDLLAGGTDTSATTMEWAMSEILRQPSIATKATEELDRVIGRDRWVEEKDIPQLPYIDAIVKETMRLHPVAVLLAPHLALQDCNVSGYDIRKGTRVLVNAWSIGRDPNIWDAPEEFRPERFLGKAIDVNGQNFELLPFGSGRRMCVGYRLGLKMIQSSLSNMLHGFHWKLPGDMKTEELNMEEVFGLTTPRKVPLVAVMEPRLPSHLY